MKLMTKSAVESGLDVLRENFRRDGYLYLEGILDVNKIERARLVVLKTLAEHGWVAGGGSDATPVGSVHRIGSTAFYACLQQLMTHEELHLLAYEEPLVRLFQSLLGQEVFAHPRKMVRLSYPLKMNPKDLIPPHQDIRYVKGERDTFTVWVPLGEYPCGHGGLRVLEGSHRHGLFPVEANEEGKFNCAASDVSLDEPRWRTAHYRMGDVLIMHSLTLHASGVNDSHEFRISIDFRYSARRGVVNSDQILPPYYPHVENWDKLSTGWRNHDLLRLADAPALEAPDAPVTLAFNRKSILD